MGVFASGQHLGVAGANELIGERRLSFRVEICALLQASWVVGGDDGGARDIMVPMERGDGEVLNANHHTGGRLGSDPILGLSVGFV